MLLHCTAHVEDEAIYSCAPSGHAMPPDACGRRRSHRILQAVRTCMGRSAAPRYPH